jgi:hypothetical protein
VAGRPFDSATHALGRTADSGVRRAAGRMGGGGTATRGRRRSLEWVGLGRGLGRLQKILGKKKWAAKIVWAENELGSTAEFQIYF